MNPDSIYKPVERPEHAKTKLHIPKRLEEALPYASKPKDERRKKNKGYIAKRAVIMDSAEKKQTTFIQALNTIRREKQSIRKAKNEERRSEKAKKDAKVEEKLDAARKARKKRQYRAEGKREKMRDAKRQKAGGD